MVRRAAKRNVTGNLCGTLGVGRTSARIADAERWAGREIAWGTSGKLDVYVYSQAGGRAAGATSSGLTGAVHAHLLGEIGVDGAVVGLDGRPVVGGAWTRELDGITADAAHSRDILAHEAGHAVINELKPLWAFSESRVGKALGEGIADSISLLTALEDEDVVTRVIASTAGNLAQDNEVTRLAEHFGWVVDTYMEGKDASKGDSATRFATNAFRLSDYGIRPTDQNADVGDPHDPGQVVLGATYDVLQAVYESFRGKGHPEREALALARDVTGSVLLRAIRHTAELRPTFEQLAVGMLRAESVVSGEHEAVIRAILVERGMLSEATAHAIVSDRSTPSSRELRIGDGSILEQLQEHDRVHPADPLLGQAVDISDLVVSKDVVAEDGVRIVRLRDSSYEHLVSMTISPDGALTDLFVESLRQ